MRISATSAAPPTANRGSLLGRTGVVVGLLIALAACGSGPSDTTAVPGEGNGSVSSPSSSRSPTDSGPGAGLEGVDVDVTNAVAPFDHGSLVDSLLVEIAISRLRSLELNECMAGEGFDPPGALTVPDRDDPSLVSNAMFPNIEKLAVDGIVRARSSAPPPDQSPQPAPGELEALAQCGARLEATGSEAESLLEVFYSVRGAWEDVLAEIDALPEVRSLVGAFSTCLRNEGIPAEFSASEIAFLSYLDGLFFAADSDSQAEIDRQMGRLYAECGRELFQARELLRRGERRSAFLIRHESAIRELHAMLFGTGTSD